MQVNGSHFRSIWLADDNPEVLVIDQTLLPFAFEVRSLGTVSDIVLSIRNMVVRGAPLIGATAACGLYLAATTDSTEANLQAAYQDLLASRPTAVNLRWALDRMLPLLLAKPASTRAWFARKLAQQICDEDVATNSGIGNHGLSLISQASNSSSNCAVNILTHCNAGWLATVDWGTALAPIFKAHDAGIPVHVWVDETRPRNQGASLTAWELGAHGIPHTVIADNAGGHLMQQGKIDLCIVGSDRTTRTGDVCNKIGTYLKALAAYDNGIPFYAALPSSTIDWTIRDGCRDIPIEERSAEEVSHIRGRDTETGNLTRIRITPDNSSAANPAFDVTPRKYINGIITERGIAKASEEALVALFPREAETRPI
ncbi:MAG TPA: S-methyl-5-thioribose-1-phosphate isomerase [Gammaproteobacteria bacterium]|nr:S-methyl-5-thioribose-1-phosphate isomerase [Gammaproteobacteria bacterium]